MHGHSRQLLAEAELGGLGVLLFHTAPAAARRATRVAPRTVLQVSAELPMRKLGMTGNPYMVDTTPSNASRKAVVQGLQGLF